MITQKDIGEYIVYSDGNIYSKYFRKMMFQKPTTNIWYKQYSVRKSAKSGRPRKMVLLHRVIAEAFIPNPENLPEVNHKDGNKRNNHIENLEWCSHMENMTHAHSNGLIVNVLRGTKNVHSKFSVVQVQVIKEAIALGFVGFQIARYFKVNRTSIYRIKSGQHWRELV